jgi:hypothetical protein
MRKRKPKIDKTCICIRYVSNDSEKQDGKQAIRIPIRSTDEDVVRVVPVSPPTTAAAG